MRFTQKRSEISLAFICLILLTAGCDTTEKPVGRMPPTLNVGEPVPDFEYHTLAAADVSLKKFSQSQGKVVYLDFWASWCKPCLISMPKLDRLRPGDGQGWEWIGCKMHCLPAKMWRA